MGTFDRGLQSDPATMIRLGQETSRDAVEFQTELKTMAINVTNLMGIWKGDSANSFNSSYQAQNGNFTAFQQLLDELGAAVGVSGNILGDTEAENTAAGKRLNQ